MLWSGSGEDAGDLERLRVGTVLVGFAGQLPARQTIRGILTLTIVSKIYLTHLSQRCFPPPLGKNRDVESWTSKSGCGSQKT